MEILNCYLIFKLKLCTNTKNVDFFNSCAFYFFEINNVLYRAKQFNNVDTFRRDYGPPKEE